MKCMIMKKGLFVSLFCCVFFCTVSAQDILLKVNGDEINAVVLVVGVDNVEYKSFGDESGQSYSLPKSEIFMIKYENGNKDVFGRKKGQAIKSEVKNPSNVGTTTTSASITAVPIDLPPASKAYKVGDLYNENGVKGFVVKATDGGKHGLLMSLESSPKKWLSDKGAKFETNSFYEDDGAKNMEAIAQYIAQSDNSWEDFPLFDWARSLGAGWYIPAKDELMDIVLTVNEKPETYNSKMVTAFNKKMKKAKGKSLLDDGFAGGKTFKTLVSSTEAQGGMVYQLLFVENIGSALVGGKAKKGKLHIMPMYKTTGGSLMRQGSRAVYKF